MPRLRDRLRLPDRRQPGPTPAEPLPPDPLLSVVLPVYQVEPYLAECLDSLLAQTYRRLEVVVVDDGSTDAGPAIAARYAARDDRVRVVRQPNGGLGAARNTGLAHARGDLVTFADSDDTVPPGAYASMVATLQRSGSDLVVGAIVRDEDGVRRTRPWVRRVHARLRLAVTVEDVPEVLTNVMACTKVFRRDFTDRIGLRFPVGVSYEDQVPITRAYLLAGSIDVLPEVVYHWRVRDEGTSISQRKAETTDLSDRLAALQAVARLLDGAAEPVRRRWLVRVFRQDLFTYLRPAADADDTYWALLRAGVEWFTARAPDDLADEVDLRVRLALWLVLDDRRAQLRALVRHEGFESSDLAVVQRGRQLVAVLPPTLSDLAGPGPDGRAGVTDAELRVRTVDLALRPRLEQLDWSVPGRLRVRCVAAVPFVDPDRVEVATSYALRGPRGTTAVPDVVASADEQAPAPGVANRVARRAHEDHTRSLVTGDLDLAALVAASGRRPVSRWVLHVRVTVLDEQVRSTVVTRSGHGSVRSVRSVIVDGALVRATWSERIGLVVEVRRGPAALTGVSRTADGLELRLLTAPPPGPGEAVTGVLVGSAPVTARLTGHGAGGELSVTLPAGDATGRPLSGQLRLASPSGRSRPVRVLGETTPVDGPAGSGMLRVSPDGCLGLGPDRPLLVVDEVHADPGALLLAGRCAGVVAAELFLRGRRADSPPAPVRVDSGRFRVRVPTTGPGWEVAPAPLPTNGYAPVAAGPGGKVRVVAGSGLDDPEAGHPGGGWSVEVGDERRLVLRRTRHEDPGTDSVFEQARLQRTTYRSARAAARADVALFECFAGTQTGDGPRAVSDLLVDRGTSLDLVWSVADPSVPAPPGTRAVLRGSREWYQLVGAARLLVSNGTLPECFEKAPGQTYVQTWHGTPIKRLGRDAVTMRRSTRAQRRQVEREVAAWDLLVSQSPFCTHVFRSGLGYEGRVLEVGRPSNDLLVGPRGEGERDRVRAALGIGTEQTVVLYAPTWREDARAGAGWAKVVHLDLRLLTTARPDLVVLLRGHPVTATQPRVGGERVVDVTTYPDVARLYLAADVLVTDYSAAMVDFSVTDKPTVLLVPDLDAYRDRVRGLYVDLAEVAPGPVVTTTEQVLAELDGGDWAAARKRVRSELAPHDDGAVTARLLDAVSPLL